MKTLFCFLFYSVNKEIEGLISLSTLYSMFFIETGIVHPFILKEKKGAVSSCLQINSQINILNRIIL